MDELDEMTEFFGNEAFEEEAAIEEGNGDEDILNSLFEDENKEEESKKRKKKGPVPAASRLNEALLMGPKGIKLLEHLFKGYKPDSKKDPYRNLEEVMKKYEHWAHVMYPKYKFEDVIAQCEKLGDKRPVRVYMMKSRMGMAMTEEEYDEMFPSKKGDELIETEHNDKDEQKVSAQSPSFESNSTVSESTGRLLGGFDEDESSTRPSISAATSNQTDEERRRHIAENRLRALKSREEKQRREQEAMDKAAREEEERKIVEEADNMMNEDEMMANFGMD